MASFAHRIQLKDFRLIQAIAETGQLARAAEELSITQPAASRMLGNIERLVGAPVFTRHPKGMIPTPIGEVLAQNATNLLRSFEKTMQETESAILGRAGNVRVGAVTGGAVAFVVPAVQDLKRSTAGADIYLDVAPSDELIAGLLKGDFDFVLSRIPPGTDINELIVAPGRVERVRFLVRNGHPLAGRHRLEPQDLGGFEWVIQPQHTPIRQAVEEAFFSRGIPRPAEVVNTTSLLVMISYLASADAIAPVAEEVASLVTSADESGFTVLDIDEQIIVSSYYVVSMKGQIMSELAARLRQLVLEKLTTAAKS